jgi:hypothetical protein
MPALREKVDWSAEARSTYGKRNWRRFWSFTYRRSKSRFRNALALVVRLTVLALLLSYPALAVLHMSNGFEVGESLAMPFEDYRVAATCYEHPADVWAYVDRLDRWPITFACAS